MPSTALDPPLKVLVEASLAVKEISSDPILIVPEVGKAAELAKTTLVTPASAARPVAKVVVAGPEEVPAHCPVPQPYPPSC